MARSIGGVGSWWLRLLKRDSVLMKAARLGGGRPLRGRSDFTNSHGPSASETPPTRSLTAQPSFKRRVRSPHLVPLRAGTDAAQLRGCQLLEDRTLLALDSTAVWADFSTLRFDPDDYDPAHVLVRFDNDVANPANYLQTLGSSVVRGA